MESLWVIIPLVQEIVYFGIISYLTKMRKEEKQIQSVRELFEDQQLGSYDGKTISKVAVEERA